MATRIEATVEDVLRLSSAGKRYELIDGRLVPMSPTGFQHGDVESSVSTALTNHVRARKLGKVVTGEVLCRLDPGGRLALAPDVAFIRRDRLPRNNRRGAYDGAPDLAVEVVSPGDSAREVTEKVDLWLRHGTLAVLLVFPESESVELCRPGSRTRLTGNDVIDFDPIVPGFRITVRDLLPPPDDYPELSDEVEASSDV